MAKTRWEESIVEQRDQGSQTDFNIIVIFQPILYSIGGIHISDIIDLKPSSHPLYESVRASNTANGQSLCPADSLQRVDPCVDLPDRDPSQRKELLEESCQSTALRAILSDN
jgi:hypothetical protein